MTSMLARALRAWPAERRTASLAATLKAVGLDTRSGRSMSTPVDEESAQRVAAVWGCVRLVSDVVATMPWDVVRTRNGFSEPVASTPTLIDTPDGGDSLPWKRKVVHSLMLRGNTYGLVTATEGTSEWPTRIDLLDADRVSWRRVGNALVPHVDSSPTLRWPRGPLWHLTAYERAGSDVGMSPVAYAATTIGVGRGAAQFSQDFFDSDAHPTALVTSESELSAEQARDIKAATKAAIANRDLLVLGSGLEWKQLQVSPADSQFLDAQRWSAQQICSAIFGVPAEMVGFSTSGQAVTYANAMDRDNAFLKYGLGPWLYRLERAMTRLLPAAQTVKFNSGGLLRADIKTRFETYSLAADIKEKTGETLLSAAEMRRLEDLPPAPGDTNAP